MKKTFLCLALSFLSIVSIQAQNTIAMANIDAQANSYMTVENDISAVEGGENKFLKVEKKVIEKLQSEVKFPELAYQFGIAGTVLLQFTFDGEIKDLKVIKSVGAGCDQAAIKALGNFPKIYQELGGDDVKSIQITVPFRFEI
jgi:TonB family protein